MGHDPGEGVGKMIYRSPGSEALLRGVYRGKVWLVQSVVIVRDSPDEALVMLEPGSRCAYPSGYWRWKHGDVTQGTRWDDAQSMDWTLKEFDWRERRFLMLLWPNQYYGVGPVWNTTTGEFEGYYVNFQLPYKRSRVGFDTFDLELDLVVDANLGYTWKDLDLYQTGVEIGVITREWVSGIEAAKADVFRKISDKAYPFDGSLLAWQPDPSWRPAHLLDGWESIDRA